MTSSTIRIVAAVICFILFIVLIVLAAILDGQNELGMSYVHFVKQYSC